MQHLLVVNGLDAPLTRIFGCDCTRCAGPARQANTSISLLSLDETGQVAHHVLFDAGGGVVDSLVSNPLLQGSRARLDWLLLTHWHPDHTIEMNRLLVSHYLTRKRRGQSLQRVRGWCRSGTAAWLNKEHAYEWQEFVDACLSGEAGPPGRLLAPVPIDLGDIQITPVTVSHFGADRAAEKRQQLRYSCAAFVVQTAAVKALLLWDLDTENQWLWDAQSEDQRKTVAFLKGADYMFIDTAFWHKPTGRSSHLSFTNVQRVARALMPRETLLVHLSGHPDGAGQPGYGWSNEQWQSAAQQVWQEEQLPGEVRVPYIGERYWLTGD